MTILGVADFIYSVGTEGKGSDRGIDHFALGTRVRVYELPIPHTFL